MYKKNGAHLLCLIISKLLKLIAQAFDTVQFRTVLTKMYGLGFSKSFLHWVINYLTNRQQLVQVNDEKSSLLTIEFGVPQGSVLGPMFFNQYVADLQEKLQLPSYQYADDTSFYFHSKVCDLDSQKTVTVDSQKTVCRPYCACVGNKPQKHFSKVFWNSICTILFVMSVENIILFHSVLDEA